MPHAVDLFDYEMLSYDSGLKSFDPFQPAHKDVFLRAFKAYRIPSGQIRNRGRVQVVNYSNDACYALFLVIHRIHYPIAAVKKSDPNLVLFDISVDPPEDFYSNGLHMGMPFTHSRLESVDYSTMGTPLTPILYIAAHHNKGLYSFDPQGTLIMDSDIKNFRNQLNKVYGIPLFEPQDNMRLISFGSLLAVYYGLDRLDMPLSLYDVKTEDIWFDFFRHPKKEFQRALDTYRRQGIPIDNQEPPEGIQFFNPLDSNPHTWVSIPG